jgi:hypothetical protein
MMMISCPALKHHAIKTLEERIYTYIAPGILNLCTGCKLVISFTLWPLYSRRRATGTHRIGKGVTRMITNDVSDYTNLLVRIAHIICNHLAYVRVIKSQEEFLR